jgi:tetratricopeptide (TPR) repeat protein
MRRAAPLTLLLASTLLACLASAQATEPRECWSLRKLGHDAQAQACFETLARASDAYTRAEGFWGLEQWTQANDMFRLAVQPDDSNPLYKVRWGLLLHERFNDGDASGLFHEALQKDPTSAAAYLGLARVSADGFDGHALEYLSKAIQLDPTLAEAHELMATLALENDDRVTAAEEAGKAIALDPNSLDAMSAEAAIALLADRSPDPWLNRVAAINPHYGPGYAEIARQLELHYRYQDAVAWYRKAVEASPRLWSAHSALGIELMRLGKEDEPRQELELSYNNGYRDRATVNSLRLLDSYNNFDTIRDSTTILKLHKTEIHILQPYLQPELHAILLAYEKKYQMKLSGPVQVEVYPDHDDFAVRTMGMPGLGALGVTFGDVVAMDSPSARRPGDFNWGATLWHEMSHGFILSATNHRVPRWFTEGLAVHEEGERSPEWSNRVTPDVLIAIRDKKLLPIARLDRGFVYPEYPSQVIVSYFQAGAICAFVKEKWGESKLLDMVHSYARVETTTQVVQQDLGLAPDAFDTQFLAWLNAKYGAEATHFDQWRDKLKSLVTEARQKQFDAVLKDGPAVVALYPEFVDDGSAYEWIAQADQALGDSKSELAILTAYEHQGGQSPELLKRLAKLNQDAGQLDEAIATLQRLNYIYPVKDEELHKHLGDLLFSRNQFDSAIREYTVLVASNPVDKAGAEFNLAQAYYAANQKDKAEESVLAALETAPGYRPAQKLLLQLQQK